MSVQLNHTIVPCRDKRRSATFLTDILGLPAPKPCGPFLVVELGNGVSLDFYETDGPIDSHHYAFLIGDDDFDRIVGRIRERELDYWTDLGRHRRGQINHNDGGFGMCFEDPDGHLLEIITRPYSTG